jgi:Lon protease-like protein
MHGNPATLAIGCAAAIEDDRSFPDSRYNIVLLDTERFRIQRERLLTATRSGRSAEVERLEDPEDGAEFVQQLLVWWICSAS